MTLVRYQPFGRCNPHPGNRNLHRHINRYFDSLNYENQTVAWQPSINVIDLEGKYEISAELPGMKREDVNIELNNNILTLSGEKKVEREIKDQSYHMFERSFGKFSRSFRLSPEVEADNIEAKFDNGILTLSLPKSEKAVAKKIEIQDN